MRPIRIAVRIPPRVIRRAGDRQLQFQQLVIRLQIRIGDRPVDADPIDGMNAEIGGMQARSERRPVNGAAAHALATVVRSKCERVPASGDSQIVPIKVMSSLFVAYPIALSVPKWPGIEANDTKSGAR